MSPPVRKPLSAFATEQLLVLLDDARAFGPDGHVDADLIAENGLRRKNRRKDHCGHAASTHLLPWGECSLPCYTLAEIKAELSTREHVPNKTERRVIRQQKARSGP